MEEMRSILVEDLAFVSGGEKVSDQVINKAKEIGSDILEKTGEAELALKAKVNELYMMLTVGW